MLSPLSIVSSSLINELVQFRHVLHRHPELSGQEVGTAQRVQQFMSRYAPDEVVTGLGGNGVAVVYRGTAPGPTVMIRADLDALPIQETGAIAHCSEIANTAHLCGHDGHTTMVAGLGAWLQTTSLPQGRVVLLFQPAEETGVGAAAVIADPQFMHLRPDYVFGLHNLPGFPLGQVLLRSTGFAAASKGIILRLQGKPSHAAHPEDGKSPAIALAQLITAITNLPQCGSFQDFVLATVIHARLGEIAFGTSPGEAEVMATLRSYRDDDMAQLTAAVANLAQAIAAQEGVTIDISETEAFPATMNHDGATNVVKQAAIAGGYDWIEADHPFRWSEDFGYFTQICPGAMFGLGAGQTQPQLHNAHYDFPDELIPYGVRLFTHIISQLLS
jgi:amidohydrolase